MRAVAVLSVLAVFLLSACTCCEDSSTAGGAGGGNATLIKLQVEGMACGVMCPPKIKEDLLTVKGVEDVKVDFETKTATVQITGNVDSDALVKSLREQFTATVKN
ncbi:MAG: heavy-metal-associated domain-containing protein [Planctomycetes bacterium]|nr:heavy-metal-associated domain-containing protein [Planctomycetota bacterium]